MITALLLLSAAFAGQGLTESGASSTGKPGGSIVDEEDCLACLDPDVNALYSIGDGSGDWLHILVLRENLATGAPLTTPTELWAMASAPVSVDGVVRLERRSFATSNTALTLATLAQFCTWRSTTPHDAWRVNRPSYPLSTFTTGTHPWTAPLADGLLFELIVTPTESNYLKVQPTAGGLPTVEFWEGSATANPLPGFEALEDALDASAMTCSATNPGACIAIDRLLSVPVPPPLWHTYTEAPESREIIFDPCSWGGE